MKAEIPDAMVVEAVTKAVAEQLESARFIDRVADAVLARFELLEPEAAAAVLGVSPRTLNERAKDWGIDKSLALGPTNPRYLLSQILERARQKVIRGRRPQLSVVNEAA